MSRLRPNLFFRATSELSQDAFLGWLLEWADADHADAEPDLHRLARAFVAALCGAAGEAAPEGEYSIRVEQQIEHADIVAELGDTHLLVIEDKVHATEHKDQLSKYREKFTANCSGRTLVLVYLKTGDQSSYASVTDKGWAVFTRANLLGVLRAERGTVTNPIYVDFLDYLETIEAGVMRYLDVPPSAWIRRDPAYRGLFADLQRRLASGRWALVNNPAGGFYGFWWAAIDIDGGQLYLQIEEHKLTVRVKVDQKSKQAAIRDLWIGLLACSAPAGPGRSFLDVVHDREFVPPNKRGTGKTMAVAVLQYDYRQLDDRNLLDVEGTVQHLQAVTQRLVKRVKERASRGS